MGSIHRRLLVFRLIGKRIDQCDCEMYGEDLRVLVLFGELRSITQSLLGSVCEV